MNTNSVVSPAGNLGSKVMRKDGSESVSLTIKRWWLETSTYFRILRNALIRPFNRAIAPEARLFARVFRADGSVENLGLIGMKVVTTVGVNYIVDTMQGTGDISTFDFHDSGTGNTAEAIGDTDLVTKVETGRQTGTPGEGASANIYQTVATISYTATRAVVEHGIFSATSGGTLFDRTVFSAINVDNGD